MILFRVLPVYSEKIILIVSSRFYFSAYHCLLAQKIRKNAPTF